MIPIELHPLGRVIHVQPGTPLRDALFPYGVEFPCGGKGRCRGCRIRVISGELPITPEQRKRFSGLELEQGWRLACQHEAREPLTLELAQWEAPVLADDTSFDFGPQEGLGIAVDLGTTTLALQLLDRANGHVLAVETALNHQSRFGADVMSRIEAKLDPASPAPLTQVIRSQIGELIEGLFQPSPEKRSQVRCVVLAGNTVMHHLFCDRDLTPLSHYPFETSQGGEVRFSPAELGWNLPDTAVVRFLPCLGSFVGSDILAGIMATRLYEQERLCALIDLGTNGEIVLGNRERMLCTSTAAGPAFEGSGISMGMRAATGAISEATVAEGQLRCRVLGGGVPLGICGSGLVDVAAAGLDLGLIQLSGRFSGGAKNLVVCAPVTVTQGDIRQLQLAKGAIAAGLRMLVRRWGAELNDIHEVFLAGAFGNYMNLTSAQRIGLIELPPDRVRPVGNSSLLGAKLALFNPNLESTVYESVLSRTQHFSLSADPEFQDIYMDCMQFPVGKAG